MFIAISTPVIVSFYSDLPNLYMFFESLSLLMSVSWILVNFRTQILIKGKPCIDLITIYQHYKGFFADALMTLPLNLLFAPNKTENIYDL